MTDNANMPDRFWTDECLTIFDSKPVCCDGVVEYTRTDIHARALAVIEKCEAAINSLYETGRILGNGYCSNEKADTALAAIEAFRKGQ